MKNSNQLYTIIVRSLRELILYLERIVIIFYSITQTL
nr:MAG TPA: hypothetical protein [Caudoviricetes sp.]DAS32491.1 MAG TPA: hypothetical protein [Caudoviricetes sp.]